MGTTFSQPWFQAHKIKGPIQCPVVLRIKASNLQIQSIITLDLRFQHNKMVFAFLTTLLLGPVIMAFEWPRTMGIETSYYFHHTHRHCHVVLLGEQNVTVPYKGYCE